MHSVSVNLLAGTDYTLEFSKNLADPIEAFLPVIEILDHVSKESLPYYFSDGTLPSDRIQLTAYPEENPSLVCLTFKPSVTGTYFNALEDDSVPGNSTYRNTPSESSPAEAQDKSCVLFIYKELRNERGEPEYYTRFKFTDDYGNTTNTVDIDNTPYVDILSKFRLVLT